jgi:hydroxymethylpyrimidine pyrophosphatase-like HAD family hydrolase
MARVTVAFDIDGTLIHQVGVNEDTPRYDVVQLYKLLEGFGCEMYVWSGGGIDYARRWRDKLGLMSAKVVMKGSFQPDIAIDDMDLDFRQVEGSLGKVNIQVKE